MLNWVNGLDNDFILSVISTVSMAAVSISVASIGARSNRYSSKQSRLTALREEKMRIYTDAIAAASKCSLEYKSIRDKENLAALDIAFAKAFIVASADLHKELLSLQVAIYDASANEGNAALKIEAIERLHVVANLMRLDLNRTPAIVQRFMRLVNPNLQYKPRNPEDPDSNKKSSLKPRKKLRSECTPCSSRDKVDSGHCD